MSFPGQPGFSSASRMKPNSWVRADRAARAAAIAAEKEANAAEKAARLAKKAALRAKKAAVRASRVASVSKGGRRTRRNRK